MAPARRPNLLATGIVCSIAPNFQTYALGINNRGAIVGYFEKPRGGPFRGFKRDANGVFERPIDNPSAAVPLTVASGINDSGVTVGYYGFSRNFFGGFVLSQGVFTNLQLGTSTRVLGINNTGDFVGTFDAHGFVSSNGVVSYVDYPGAGNTEAQGIAADGTIVGDFRIGDMTFAFIRGPGGQFKPLRISSEDTAAYGVNSAVHTVVGAYGNGLGGYVREHGFVYDYITDAITTVDWPDPNTFETVVTGINSQGEIVGWVRIKDPQKGLQPPFSFIRTPQ